MKLKRKNYTPTIDTCKKLKYLAKNLYETPVTESFIVNIAINALHARCKDAEAKSTNK